MACQPDYPGWLAIFFNYHPFIKKGWRSLPIST